MGWQVAKILRVLLGGCQRGAWLCLGADFGLDGDARFLGK
jgi:hypothetical protein